MPRVGGDWGACDPNEPRNFRLRCSVIVELDGGSGERPTRVLIDTSPDLRTQLLATGTTALDGLIFTHDHADQTHGIDDLRPLVYRMGKRIPTFMDQETASSLETKFRYVFEGQGGYPPILDLQDLIKPEKVFAIDGPGGRMEILPIRQVHGAIVSLGFRIGGLAYCNDVNALPCESLAALEGIDTFIVDALRYAPHGSHAHLEQSLEWRKMVGARHTILTNLHVDMDYQALLKTLPSDVVPAYDGMAVALPYQLDKFPII